MTQANAGMATKELLDEIHKGLQQEGLSGPVASWLTALAEKVFRLEAELEALRAPQPDEGGGR